MPEEDSATSIGWEEGTDNEAVVALSSSVEATVYDKENHRAYSAFQHFSTAVIVAVRRTLTQPIPIEGSVEREALARRIGEAVLQRIERDAAA